MDGQGRSRSRRRRAVPTTFNGVRIPGVSQGHSSAEPSGQNTGHAGRPGSWALRASPRPQDIRPPIAVQTSGAAILSREKLWVDSRRPAALGTLLVVPSRFCFVTGLSPPTQKPSQALGARSRPPLSRRPSRAWPRYTRLSPPTPNHRQLQAQGRPLRGTG